MKPLSTATLISVDLFRQQPLINPSSSFPPEIIPSSCILLLNCPAVLAAFLVKFLRPVSLRNLIKDNIVTLRECRFLADAPPA